MLLYDASEDDSMHGLVISFIKLSLSTRFFNGSLLAR